MTRVSKWRVRGYWTFAALLLPIANPPLFLIAASLVPVPWPGAGLLVAGLNWLLLWPAAAFAWPSGEKRRGRVAWGLAAAALLSFPVGFAELVIYLDAACPDAGCFN